MSKFVNGNIEVTQIRGDNRHGDSAIAQMSDGTGTSGNVAKFNSNGSLTDGGGVFPSFADNETPSGMVNGTNVTFTLAHTPNPSAGVQLYVSAPSESGGILQIQGTDYTLSGTTITFSQPPANGAVITAFYRY